MTDKPKSGPAHRADARTHVRAKKRSQRTARFWGGTPSNTARSKGKGIATGARQIALTASRKAASSQIKASLSRGAAKKADSKNTARKKAATKRRSYKK